MKILIKTLALIFCFSFSVTTIAQSPTHPMVPEKIGSSSWYVQGVSALGSTSNRYFISNAGFVVTPTGVIVIDALGSPALAQELLQHIQRISGGKPVTHVIVTHYHADHIYGLQAFKAVGAKIIAHSAAKVYLNSETAQLRLQASRTELAPYINDQTQLIPADLWLDGSTRLTLSGVEFVINAVGPSHTPEDLVVYVPSEGVLFAGDLVFRGRVPFVGQADSKHWVAALDQLLLLNAKSIVPGHGPASSNAQADLQLTRDYLVYLRSTMGKAAKAMEPFEEAYAATDWSRFETMPLFKVANRMNAYNTYLLMESEP